MRVSALCCAALLFVTARAATADEKHGHDHDHGSLGNIGKAHIDTSCKAAAQKAIDRGVALMHSFWYAEAEKSFREASAADRQCAMAWWGVAMANYHPIWAPPTPDELATGRAAAERARNIRKGTARERAYVNAINTFYASDSDHRSRAAAYERAMAELASSYSKDNEAAIFHALAILSTVSPTDKTYAKQKQAAEILNRVLPLEPEHPGIAHYIIHSFDYPELASFALPAARVYAKLAPGSPHALHMPSHIFTRLGLWEESIKSNADSAAKARSYMAMAAPGTTSFDELHAGDYLVYAYLQQGRDDEALKLVQQAANVRKIDNTNFAAAYAISAAPARYALERRQWKEAAALTVPTNISWEKFPYAEANIHFARAIGAARSGSPDIAREAIARLQSIRATLLEKKDQYWADQVEIQRLGAAAWVSLAEGNREEALELMRASADLEATTDKHPVTPGAIIPARELLAEMLLETGNASEALVEARRNLTISPNRRQGLLIASQAEAKSSKTTAMRR